MQVIKSASIVDKGDGKKIIKRLKKRNSAGLFFKYYLIGNKNPYSYFFNFFQIVANYFWINLP